MINLLPPQGKKIFNHEYRYRAGTVMAILITAALAVGSMLLVPTYVLVRSQFAALKVETDVLDEIQSKDVDSEPLVKEVNLLAAELGRMSDTQKLSQVLSAINQTADSGISVTSFAVMRTDEGIGTIYLDGNAASRDALTSFRDTLEQDPLFARAIIPISNLVRSEGLPFTMEVTLSSDLPE